MPSLKTTITLLTPLIAMTFVLASPPNIIDRNAPLAACTPPSESTPTEQDNQGSSSTSSTVTPAAVFEIEVDGERKSCDYAFCDERGTSWCFYWHGVTAYDVSRGASPAETKVPMGLCGGN
ncbi:hypothetical protein E4U40_000364 [Claviceps sp. LM458 group G5]|nr:hypothetical protein E4U40_000364 [Claviceps sp. LM458 group G5]